MKMCIRIVASSLDLKKSWKKSKRAFQLSAIVISTSLMAAAQVGPVATMLDREPFGRREAQQSISTNALRAPAKAQGELQRAREALWRGRDADASKHLDRALIIYPDYALALLLRGVVKMRSGNLQEACPDFEQAIEHDPNLGAAYVALGTVYNLQGNFHDASPVLNRATPFFPTAWFLHYESAVAQLGTGKIDAAWQSISKAVDNLPAEPYNRSAVFYVRGRVLLKLENYPNARSAFAQAINEDPQGEIAKLARRFMESLTEQ